MPLWRRGLAPRQALRAARVAGFESVRTFNETHNQGMLAINEKLGFAREPAMISLKLQLKPEPAQPT